MSKNTAPVAITREDRALRKGRDLLAFALTGGGFAPISAAKAINSASYNARTFQPAAKVEQATGRRGDCPPGHVRTLAAAAEQAARRVLERGIAWSRLSLAAQLAYDRLKAPQDGGRS